MDGVPAQDHRFNWAGVANKMPRGCPSNFLSDLFKVGGQILGNLNGVFRQCSPSSWISAQAVHSPPPPPSTAQPTPSPDFPARRVDMKAGKALMSVLMMAVGTKARRLEKRDYYTCYLTAVRLRGRVLFSLPPPPHC